jgi:hypothetical protein
LTREYHAEKYGDVHAEEDMGEADRRLVAPDPGRGHDALARVLVGEDFAALVGFVLHTPLADFLPKGKAGHLASTSNAVGHGDLRVSVDCRRRKILSTLTHMTIFDFAPGKLRKTQ